MILLASLFFPAALVIGTLVIRTASSIFLVWPMIASAFHRGPHELLFITLLLLLALFVMVFSDLWLAALLLILATLQLLVPLLQVATLDI